MKKTVWTLALVAVVVTMHSCGVAALVAAG